MAAPNGAFPRELLNQSTAQRLTHFTSLTIGHPLLLQAYDELRYAIRDSAPGSLILVNGPPGAGKTTLLQRVEKHLVETSLLALEADRERLPVARVEAIAPESGSFNWKDYLRRLLTALMEPLVDCKVDPGRWAAGRYNNSQLIDDHRAVSTRLRHAAEQALRHRRPHAVLVDDAQHLAIISSGRKLLDQLNTVKSMANTCRTTHVLCGTYELLVFRNLSGQLSRRSVDIHFPRYRAEHEEHRQAFLNVLWTFQNHLPLDEPPDLTKDWDYFYERSIGCVGVLKDWLSRSLALALEDGGKKMRHSHISRRALSVAQCSKMLSEAAEGERILAETEESRRTLRTQLGLDAEADNLCARTSDKAHQLTIATARRRRPAGRRNPVRDKVGVEAAS